LSLGASCAELALRHGGYSIQLRSFRYLPNIFTIANIFGSSCGGYQSAAARLNAQAPRAMLCDWTRHGE
jgi:hypothetical protein